MKKILLLLMIVLSINAIAQFEDSRHGSIVSSTYKGILYSGAATLGIYEIAYTLTPANHKQSKWIGAIGGFIISGTLALASENSTLKAGYGYDNTHILRQITGGVVGANIVFLIGPKNPKKRKIKWWRK